ncbi:hypothetical protein Tco_0678536 [Tanacetum coccineum]|uniref:Uncharacterized protein n=1 Tax=Tanacetum coccineum TaxID=301880 RepID=A0ABQ4XGP5_9ASTR
MFKCVRPLAGKTFQKEFRSAGWCKENRDGQKTVAEDSTPPSMCQTISNIDAHVEGEQFHESKQSRNHVKKIHLKMNLPDHRSVLTDPKGQVKMEMEIPHSSGVNSERERIPFFKK